MVGIICRRLVFFWINRTWHYCACFRLLVWLEGISIFNNKNPPWDRCRYRLGAMLQASNRRLLPGVTLRQMLLKVSIYFGYQCLQKKSPGFTIGATTPSVLNAHATQRLGSMLENLP